MVHHPPEEVYTPRRPVRNPDLVRLQCKDKQVRKKSPHPPLEDGYFVVGTDAALDERKDAERRRRRAEVAESRWQRGGRRI